MDSEGLYRSSLFKHIAPVAQEQRTVLIRLFDKLFYIAASVGVVALLVSLLQMVHDGLQWIFVVQSVFFIVGLGLLVARRHLPLNLLSITILLFLAANGIAGLLFNGLLGQGILSLGCVSILTGVLWGRRTGITVSLIVSAVVLLIGLGISSGTLPVRLTVLETLRHPSTWITTTIGLVFFLMIIIESISSIQDKMVSSMEGIRNSAIQLQSINNQLNAQIVERRHAESELRHSEERFRLVAENIQDVVVLMDESLQVVYITPSVRRPFGYEPEEVIGQSISCLLSEDSFHSLGTAVQEGLHRDSLFHRLDLPLMEHEFIGKDERRFFGELQVSILTRDGRCIGIQGTVRDINDRKLLQQEKEQLAMVVEQVHESIIIFDPSGVIAYANPAAGAVSGYPPCELVGSAIGAIRRNSQPGDYWKTIRAGEVWKGRWSHLRKDGVTAIEDVTISPLRDTQQRLTGYIASSRDISEQLVLEEKLRHSEKLQAIGQLAGGVAHDFNNQLTAILGNADLIRALADDQDEIRQCAGEIKRSAQSSADLTRKLLAFARKGQMQFSYVNIHEVIGEVVAILSHSIDKRIRIRQRLDAVPPLVQGDASQLQNALLNLGINARDAMAQGGELVFATETIELNAARYTLLHHRIVPGTYLRISVIDSGSGMSAPVMQHLFEPFFTTKEPGRGTGMGLAAVFGTVQSHHGEIDVASTPDKGSTFVIYLPAAQPETNDRTTESTTPVQHPRLRILVVDDEDVVRKAAECMLRSLGHDVVCCSTGVQALERFQLDRSFDLVLLDMIMPEMNGRDTFAALRRIDPQVTVILATGYSVEQDAAAMLKDGLAAVILKPFSLAQLSRTIAGAVTKTEGLIVRGT